MTAHTPGPWMWSPNPSGGASVQTQSAGIASVLSRAGVPHPVQESCEANARLIAAAPDLLEALLRMRDEVREFLPNVCGDALTEAEAAITKATGGDR